LKHVEQMNLPNMPDELAEELRGEGLSWNGALIVSGALCAVTGGGACVVLLAGAALGGLAAQAMQNNASKKKKK
jgi:alkylation response protein AidB-like acyl-CoA dehydrogenase